MKGTMLKGALVVASVAVALVLAEAGLAVHGRYNHLVSRRLVTSPALWEPPADTVEYEPHPDLDTAIEIRLDSTGVRNQTSEPTDTKTHIIAFFGDSFTDNRRVADQFTFTTLLDDIAESPWRVVSYGVDGYGLDQAYLRYRKYEDHDIRHVVYLFTENDLRNLYETNLVQVSDGRVAFRVPGRRVVHRVLGRIRLTYLAIEGYHAIRGSASGLFADEHAIRFHDAYADAVVSDFLSDEPTQTVELAATFRAVLRHWQQECEARGQTFTILVLPRDLDTAVASKLLQPFSDRVIYLWELFGREMPMFVNDDHWDEYGNLRLAEVLSTLEELPFHSAIARRRALDGARERIDRYYEAHGSKGR